MNEKLEEWLLGKIKEMTFTLIHGGDSGLSSHPKYFLHTDDEIKGAIKLMKLLIDEYQVFA